MTNSNEVNAKRVNAVNGDNGVNGVNAVNRVNGFKKNNAVNGVNAVNRVNGVKKNNGDNANRVNVRTNKGNIIRTSNRNVYYISYSGVLTGSQELRDYNAKLIKDKTLYGGNKSLTKFGEYCKLYDVEGKKGAEPFFDSIVAQIATLKNEKFDEFFEYLKVIPETTKPLLEGKNSNLTIQNLNMFTTGSGIKFKLVVDGEEPIIIQRPDNYDSGRHIFILGPISDDTLSKIYILVRKATLKEPLFIHMQGENGVYNSKNAKNANSSTLIGMKKKDGVFANAFNFQGNMYNANRFRNHMKRVAQCYTVCLKTDARGTNGSLPPIMIQFYNNIITKYIREGTNKINNTNSTKLDIAHITQDIYDKDNFVSLSQLLQNSRPTTLELTGKAYFTKETYETRETSGNLFNKLHPPPIFRTGWKGKFNNGHNMLGGQNNSNNKGVSSGWKYNEVLTNNINNFIVSCWVKCGIPNLPKPKVVFMDQKTIRPSSPHKPIGFHENMFVNAAGYWFQVFNKIYMTKANIFKTTGNKLKNKPLTFERK